MHEENIALVSPGLDGKLCFILVGESHTVALLRAVSQKLGGFSLCHGALRRRCELGGGQKPAALKIFAHFAPEAAEPWGKLSYFERWKVAKTIVMDSGLFAHRKTAATKHTRQFEFVFALIIFRL